MDNLVVLSHSAELINKPSCERAAGKGTAFVVHRTNLFNAIAHDVVTLAAVGQHLIVEIASQHVDVPIVEADGVGRPAKLEFVDQLQSVGLEVEFVDVGRLLFWGICVCSSDQVEVPVGD